MQRLILTFSTLHKVLAAQKVLASHQTNFRCRVTPTPAGLGDSICGMAIEILDTEMKDRIIACLARVDLKPSGIHQS
jgi:hypothetical protein